VLLLIAAQALAQSSASYQIPRHSIDGGASLSSSASFALSNSIGQPDAGRASSASFALSGGFQRAAGNPADDLFRNGFE
jgi:hypothetical protein